MTLHILVELPSGSRIEVEVEVEVDDDGRVLVVAVAEGGTTYARGAWLDWHCWHQEDREDLFAALMASARAAVKDEYASWRVDSYV